MDFRCPHKLHGVLVVEDEVEFKCDSRYCGHAPGVVVLHRFSLTTGEMVGTRIFKDPHLTKEGRS